MSIKKRLVKYVLGHTHALKYSFRHVKGHVLSVIVWNNTQVILSSEKKIQSTGKKMFLLVFKKGDTDTVIDVNADGDKCSIRLHQEL